MANRRRGEVEAVVDGVPVTLCLTLGALCELEAAFGADDLAALGERFASGHLSARDLLRIFACGLRGGGDGRSDAEVAELRVDGGLAGVVAAVAALLEATFGAPEASAGGVGGAGPEAGGENGAPRPPVVPGRAASPSPGTR